MVCVQSVAGKNKLLVQFEDGQRKEMSYCSLHFLCSKEEVNMDKAIKNLPEKDKGEFSIIYGDSDVE